MNCLTTTTRLLLPLGLSVSAGAQTPPIQSTYYFGSVQNEISLATYLTGNSGEMRRLISADTNGDGAPDAAWLQGGKVFCAPNHDAQDWAGTLGFYTANDLDAYQEGTSQKRKLVTAGADGIRIWTSDASGTNWTHVPVVDPLANGASIVRSADLDGDGDQDLIYVINGLDVRYLYRSLTGWTSMAGFTVPNAGGVNTHVIDLQTLDFDGNGTLEIAVQQQNGVNVRQQNGTSLGFARTYVLGSGGFTTFTETPSGAAPLGRVAYVTKSTSVPATGLLHFLRFGPGMGCIETYTLPQTEFKRIDACDIDADADCDFVLSDQHNLGSLMFNRSNEQGWLAGPYPCYNDPIKTTVIPGEAQPLTWASGIVPSGQTADIRFCEVDRDGLPDLTIVHSFLNQVQYRSHAPIVPEIIQAPGAPPSSPSTGLQYWKYFGLYLDENNTANPPLFADPAYPNLAVEPAHKLGVATQWPMPPWMNANGFEVIVYGRVAGASGGPVVNPTNHLIYRTPVLGEGTGFLVPTLPTSNNLPSFWLPFPVTKPNETLREGMALFSRVYFLKMRRVELNAANEVVNVGRWLVAGLCGDEPTASGPGNISYLTGLQGTGGPGSTPLAHKAPAANSWGSVTKIGGLVPLGDLPSFENNGAPGAPGLPEIFVFSTTYSD